MLLLRERRLKLREIWRWDYHVQNQLRTIECSSVMITTQAVTKSVARVTAALLPTDLLLLLPRHLVTSSSAYPHCHSRPSPLRSRPTRLYPLTTHQPVPSY